MAGGIFRRSSSGRALSGAEDTHLPGTYEPGSWMMQGGEAVQHQVRTPDMGGTHIGSGQYTAQPNMGAGMNYNPAQWEHTAPTPGLPVFRPSMSGLIGAAGYEGGSPLSNTGSEGRPGQVGLTQGAFESQQQIQLQHDLRNKDRQSLTALLDKYFGKGDEAAGARVEYNGPTEDEERAARAAAFGRAKETAALNARASMSALEDMTADRGLMGSSVEAAKGGQIIGAAQSDVADFTREQLMQDLNRAKEVANMKYQGGITQRGQELGRQQQIQSAIMSLIGGLY